MPIDKEEVMEKIYKIKAELAELESMLLSEDEITEDIPKGEHLPQPED